MPEPIKAVTKRFYPALLGLVNMDDLPEFLNFAESGLDVMLSKVFYKNFQYSKSFRSDAAFYSLDVTLVRIKEVNYEWQNGKLYYNCITYRNSLAYEYERVV